MGRDAFGRPRSAFAEMARTGCSECGYPVEWMQAQDLPWEVPAAERLRVFELVGFCGRYADAWHCTQCGNWGVFEGHSLF